MSTLLNVKDVQERLGVSEATLFRMLKAGELKGFKVGGGRAWRFEESDIEEYIKQQRELAEARQPGALTVIAEFVKLFPKNEQRELEQWILGVLRVNPHIRVKLEEVGLVFGNALTPDGPVTLTVNEQRVEEKRAELAARR